MTKILSIAVIHSSFNQRVSLRNARERKEPSGNPLSLHLKNPFFFFACRNVMPGEQFSKVSLLPARREPLRSKFTALMMQPVGHLRQGERRNCSSSAERKRAKQKKKSDEIAQHFAGGFASVATCCKFECAINFDVIFTNCRTVKDCWII